MSVKMSDVAKAAKVSKATVSLVLNGNARALNISPRTIERVQASAKSLGYIPNIVARNLRARRTGQIGVSLAGLDDLDSTVRLAFDGAWLLGLTVAAKAHQLPSIVLYSQADNDDNLNSYYDGRIDGLLLRSDARTPHPLLDVVDPTRVPTVAVWTQDVPEAMGFADVDHVGGARLAVEHLLELGHRRIAFLDSEPHDYNRHFDLRREGYQQALKAAGIKPRPSWHVRSGQAALALLRAEQPVTAIFVANDPRAVALIRDVRQAGFDIPRDVSVVGFDNLFDPRHAQNELTTVHHPMPELAAEALKNLLALIQGKPVRTCRSLVPTHLVVRHTTAAPKRHP